MKRNTYSRKMKFKLWFLAGAVIILIMAIVMNQCGREKEKRQYKEHQEQKSTETEQKLSNEPQGKATKESNRKDTTLGLPANAMKKDITAKINNLDEYATKLTGNHTDLLNQEFSKWLKEKKISATSGSIFYVLVPDNDPGSIEFFIHIDDSQGSLFMLSYHTRENVVTASTCKHTEKEIKSGVFEENGPAQCDISETEDAKIRNNQEGTNATK